MPVAGSTLLDPMVPAAPNPAPDGPVAGAAAKVDERCGGGVNGRPFADISSPFRPGFLRCDKLDPAELGFGKALYSELMVNKAGR